MSTTNVDEIEDNDFGPSLEDAVKRKKRKIDPFEPIYLENLPNAESYEKSYMHRDVISSVIVTKTDFIITASVDGHVKFWKKMEGFGIEFVKHFKTHLGPILNCCASANGELYSTISSDKYMKIFDIINFDMINIINLGYVPRTSGWVYSSRDAIPFIAVAEQSNSQVHIYDARGTSTPVLVCENLHSKPVVLIQFNPVFDVIVSVDQSSMMEYWVHDDKGHSFPSNVAWEYKTDTDLYEYCKVKSTPLCISFSPDGNTMAIFSSDRKVRLFKFLTGKIWKVFDESLKSYSENQKMSQQIPSMEFGRRMAVERDFEKSEFFQKSSIIFDKSGNFILYPTMLGVKVVNIKDNRCCRVLGSADNVRFVNISLFQTYGKSSNQAVNTELEASDNPSQTKRDIDPTLLTSAFKKNRFYLFSKREPSFELERDIFNEKPTKEEIISSTEEASFGKAAESAVIHTTLGDLTIQLFYKECPKTIENFCTHARNNYYNGHLFHRVIKGFMVQTGDPTGVGTGGVSIWGGEFEDEFHPSLKHDRPYTLSMANAGPNTNGSQFFLTVVPAPWLDNKHTVFGRVTRGMEVVHSISNLRTNPKTDKPWEDNECRILNVNLK